MSTMLSPPTSPAQRVADDLAKLQVRPPSGDDELERFRREWRNEVQAKKGEVSVGNVRWKEQQASSSSPEKVAKPLADRPPPPEPLSPVKSPKALPPKVLEGQAGPSRPPREGALQAYTRAVESEQTGKLNEALMLYRKAFKMDDSVDKLYARTLRQAAPALEEETPSSADIVSAAAPSDEPYTFQRHIQVQPDYEKAPAPLHTPQQTPQARPSPLTAMLDALPVPAHSIDFLPADEQLPMPIASLPPELLGPILAHLDVASIERFAMTCWRARYLTATSDVWKRIAEGIYRHPAMMGGREVELNELARRYRGEWRTALVEEERVRLDGCYISVCHYIRAGAGDQWVAITHMITYHRFLRFYPDGSVISFLTTDHPSEVVPLLRPSLRAKGLHFGRWQLIRSDAEPPDPTITTRPGSSSIKGRARIMITTLLEPGTASPKYEFEMELALRETGRGKWNKLDMVHYRSINLATEESLGLSLKHQKPFYFSKVRSYNPPF